MSKERHAYLIRLQYLGFRYSGWQIQPEHLTVEGMLTKTLKYVLPEGTDFKILGAGRTDAKVSALNAAFELLIHRPIDDFEDLLAILNTNLPPDIRILSIKPSSDKFNIIKDAKNKQYVYLFSFGGKNHPFCAPFLASIQENLDLGLMKKAARIFEGTHDFANYTVKEKRNSNTIRTISSCRLGENELLTASFFPKRSYLLTVEGPGFLRYQIRMIMGALIQLGRGGLSLQDIKVSLQEGTVFPLSYIAPGSGLLLNHLDFGPAGDGFLEK
ncbi:tRNA pseudouridine(38-40) synthase TruA [Pricia sp. S334]|uniref:tRNA pseudouridine synthase A n=1 Tax=Pricia mediterranea TaxID=3076079 RepID=A0ABU3LA33_9FLAO|nr:tRNA pseudouridine(38-40) synthase TruA [Pricia sp. S334]MDT7830600.1 tRNA pseudouridine(38-40) synthase TruA [Pricia sp. S334]